MAATRPSTIRRVPEVRRFTTDHGDEYELRRTKTSGNNTPRALPWEKGAERNGKLEVHTRGSSPSKGGGSKGGSKAKGGSRAGQFQKGGGRAGGKKNAPGSHKFSD